MNSKTIYEDKFFYIQKYEGNLLESNHRAHTEVMGGGSDWGVTIRSHTHEYTRFFLIDEDGSEKGFQIYNWDFPMRSGNHIQVYGLFNYGLFNQKSNRGDYIFLQNDTSGDVSFNENQIKSIVQAKFKPLMIGSIAFLMFGFPMLIPFLLLPLEMVLPSLVKWLNNNINILLFWFLILPLLAIYPLYLWKCHQTISAIKKAVLAAAR